MCLFGHVKFEMLFLKGSVRGVRGVECKAGAGERSDEVRSQVRSEFRSQGI